MAEEANYRIVVRGELSERWAAWFDGLELSLIQEPGGEALTILLGPVADQAELRGMLCRLWDLNLTLLSVSQMGADPPGRSGEKPKNG